MVELFRTIRALSVLLIIPLAVGGACAWPAVSWASRWWLGMTVTGIFLIVLHALNVPATVVVALSSAVMIGATVLTLLRLKRARLNEAHARLSRHEIGAAIALFSLLACVDIYVVAQPILTGHWDGLVIWYRKAKALFYWPPFNETAYAGDSYKNYPNLGPMWEMIVMRAVGLPFENYGRLVFPTAYFFWAWALFGLRPRSARPVALWIVPVIALFSFDRESFTSGYQDAFLAVAGGMAAVHFTRFFMHMNSAEDGSDDHAVYVDGHLGFFFAGAGCFIKNEGAVMGLVVVTSFFLTLLATNRPRRSLAAALRLKWSIVLFGALFVLWPLLLAWNKINLENISGKAFSLHSILHLYENAGRWHTIKQALFPYVYTNGGRLYASLLFTLLSLWLVPGIRRALLFLWLTWIAHTGAIVLIFFATQLKLEHHLRLAFSRLMDQHFFAATIILALCTMALWDKAFPKEMESV